MFLKCLKKYYHLFRKHVDHIIHYKAEFTLGGTVCIHLASLKNVYHTVFSFFVCNYTGNFAILNWPNFIYVKRTPCFHTYMDTLKYTSRE